MTLPGDYISQEESYKIHQAQDWEDFFSSRRAKEVEYGYVDVEDVDVNKEED